ncbi:MAG: PAS domain-containing protein [Candidatus Auribacterota bacterium]
MLESIRSFFDEFPYIIDCVDSKGKIVFWNQAAEKETGYSSKTVLTHPDVWTLLYPDAGYRELQFSAASLKMWRLAGDLFHITTNEGISIPVWLTLVPVYNLFPEYPVVKLAVGVTNNPPIGQLFKKLRLNLKDNSNTFSFIPKAQAIPYDQAKLSVFLAQRMVDLDRYAGCVLSGKEPFYSFNG